MPPKSRQPTVDRPRGPVPDPRRFSTQTYWGESVSPDFLREADAGTLRAYIEENVNPDTEGLYIDQVDQGNRYVYNADGTIRQVPLSRASRQALLAYIGVIDDRYSEEVNRSLMAEEEDEPLREQMERQMMAQEDRRAPVAPQAPDVNARIRDSQMRMAQLQQRAVGQLMGVHLDLLGNVQPGGGGGGRAESGAEVLRVRIGEHPRYKKYATFMRMRMPAPAIFNRMLADGIPDDVAMRISRMTPESEVEIEPEYYEEAMAIRREREEREREERENEARIAREREEAEMRAIREAAARPALDMSELTSRMGRMRAAIAPPDEGGAEEEKGTGLKMKIRYFKRGGQCRYCRR